MAKAGSIRGLQVFIGDIRACQNKEQETKRVDKELAKIRGKFGDDKKALTAYDRKKYVWKLLYIYMLGYDVEFGHKQACDLIPSQKYSEKQVGYMACSILMNEKDEFLRLAINGIHNDLVSRNEAFQSLALTFVGNIAGAEMAEALMPDVLALLQSGTVRSVVRKKAALCLLRLMRKTPADAQLVSAESFAPVISHLLEERDLGLLLSVVTLLLGICIRSSSAGYEQCHSKLLRLLERLVYLREVTADYTYYGIASPWLQAKVLRTLQLFPLPEGTAAQQQLHDVLLTIFNSCADATKHSTINKSNAQHAILFEAISLILALECSRDLLASSVSTLGRFLSVKEPNIRYLALETLTRLALVPEVQESIMVHQATIIANLKDTDVSIRRRALDLLFTMCDGGSAVEVVEELVKYLTIADFSMREELVLKICILAEKFAPNVQWYVDVVLALLERAGDFCGDDIWHRVVQLITNNEGSQAYAALQVVEVLNRGANHEALMSMAAYVLGEYGRLIKDQVPMLDQFKLLHERFLTSSTTTKGLLLTAYLKLLLSDAKNATLQSEVTGVFGRYSRQMEPELQQRSAEYLVLAQNPTAAAASYVLPMPRWEGRESALLKRLAASEGNDADAAEAPVPADDALVLGTGPAVGALSAALGGANHASPPAAPAPAPAAPAPAPQVLPGQETTKPAPEVVQPTSVAPAPLPDFDLLGEDLLDTRGASPASAPAAPPSNSSHVDPLDELFAVPASTSTMANGIPASVAPQHIGPQQTPAPASHLGSTALSASTASSTVAGGNQTGAAGLQGGPAAQTAAFNTASAQGPSSTGSWTAGFDATAGMTDVSSSGVPGIQPAVTGASAAAAAAVSSGAISSASQQDQWRIMGDVRQWHKALLTKDKGILYEDTYLQIGLQSKFTRATGDLQLFLGNKHASQSITGLTLLSSPSPALQVLLGQWPAHLAPKQQVQVAVQVACLHPFLEAPKVQLQYSCYNHKVVQELALPVLPHKFMVPESTIAKEVFFDRWKAYQGPPLKLQQMVERATALSIESTLLVLRNLSFGVEHLYLDPSPHNEAGAGYFVCGQHGVEQALLCQCRVEGNPQNRRQFRVTVAAPDAALAASLRDMLLLQMEML